MKRWSYVAVTAASIVLTAAVVLAATDGAEPSPDERFVESICATQLATLDEILDVYDAVIHTRATPGEDGWGYLVAHAYRAHEIARKYRRAIRAIEVPETAAGQRVAGFMEQYSRSPLAVTSEVMRRIKSVAPKDMTLIENIQALNNFERDLGFIQGELMSGGFINHPNVASGVLTEEFESADSCKRASEAMFENDG